MLVAEAREQVTAAAPLISHLKAKAAGRFPEQEQKLGLGPGPRPRRELGLGRGRVLGPERGPELGLGPKWGPGRELGLGRERRRLVDQQQLQSPPYSRWQGPELEEQIAFLELEQAQCLWQWKRGHYCRL